VGGETFLGRQEFLKIASDVWERALSGERQSILLAGSPGIGKTRLAAEIADSLEKRSATTHWGRAWESGGAPALWPWIQILRGCLALGAASRARAALGARATFLDEVVSSAQTALHDVPLEAPFALFDTIENFLSNLSVEEPLLLLLDDLHAADPSSLHLLEFIARQRSQARILLIATFRPAELSNVPRGEETISSVSREGELLELGGLSDEDVRALARALNFRLSDDAVMALPLLSGGNPLVVRELARVEDGGLSRPGAMTFSNAIRRRVDGAGGGNVMRVAATIGRRVPFDLVLEVVDGQEGDARRYLGRAAAEGLIEIDPQADAFTFSHDLVRSSLYEDIGAEAREQLHARIAGVLERRYRHRLEDQADLIAHHHLHSGVQSLDKAIQFLRMAGEVSMRRFAYEAAQGRFQQAVDLLDEPSEVRCDLLIALGTAQRRGGEASADATLTEAARLARDLGDGNRLATALIAFVGNAGSPYIRMDSWLALVEDALENAPPDDDRLKARLLASLTSLLSDPEEDERRSEILEQALELATSTGEDFVKAEVLYSAGLTMFFLRNESQERFVDELLELVARLKRGASPILALRARELELFGRRLRTIFLLENGDVLGFENEASAVIKGAEELGQPVHLLGAECLRSAKDQMVGRVDQIERRSATFPQMLPDSLFAFVAYWVSTGWALFEQDRLSELRDLLTSLLESMPRLTGIRLFLAMEAIQNDRYDDARTVMAPIATNVAGLPHDAQWLSFVAGSAWILKELGDKTACADVYDLLLAHRDKQVIIAFGQASLYLGSVELHLGMAAAGAQNLEVAIDHYERAVSVHEAIGAPAWAGRSGFELAVALASIGEDATRSIDLARQALGQIENTAMHYLRRLIEGFLDEHDRAPGRDAIEAFEKEGDVWLVKAFGMEARIKSIRGMEYLARLVSSPGVEIHASDLLSGGSVRSDDVPPIELGVGGGADPVLDERAKKEFARRLRELEEDIDEAQSHNDPEKAARLEMERDVIMDELGRVTGIMGRTRSFSDASEKARVSVTKATKRAIALIRPRHPQLAEHLEARITTGTFCSYRPSMPI